MVECPKCKNQYKDHITYCVFCGLDLVPVETKLKSQGFEKETEQNFFAESATATVTDKLESSRPVGQTKLPGKLKPGIPPLSAVFALLGVCSLLGGFAYAVHLWPEKLHMIYGFLPSSACFPSFTAFLMGLIACCLCFAMAQIISSLRSLEYFIYQIANKE